MPVVFDSWQRLPYESMGKAPYNAFSPNLVLVRLEMRELFGATGGTGYVIRAVRAGEDPSSHGFGAAWDPGIPDPAIRQAAIDWLLTNHVKLHIQAVHDYVGSRLWRAGRGWQNVTPSASKGWGQPWAKWLHIEVTRAGWGDTTPMAQRGLTALGPAPAPADEPWPAPPINATTPRSEKVRVLQRRLTKLGINVGRDDGVCGPRTVAGIKKLQERLGFTGRDVDGRYGNMTAGEAQRRFP